MARKKSVVDHFSTMQTSSPCCPLCKHQQTQEYYQDRRRPYFQCNECGLVFVPDSFHISAELEKAEYDLHQNSFEDEGYRRFLSRAFDPIAQRIPVPATGLDFGCGPGPVLASMFSEFGYEMQTYDPYYATDVNVLEQSYDFITCTEVIEHVSQPDQVFPLLINRLSVNGVLLIMTKRVRDREAFASWHYKNDQTHICFYCEPTFDWIAQQYGLIVDFIGSDVVLFKKS